MKDTKRFEEETDSAKSTSRFDKLFEKWEEAHPSEWGKTTASDFICFPLARLIEKEGKCSLKDLEKKTGLSRRTVHTHLKHLVRDGVLSRESVIKGRGRPTVLYSRTEKSSGVLKYDKEAIVTLRFAILRNVCRLQKGQCDKTKKYCTSDLCPLIMR